MIVLIYYLWIRRKKKLFFILSGGFLQHDMRPRTDRRRRWKRRWAERRGATENQRRCVRVPWRIIVRGYYYPRTFPFSQTLSNRDKHESFLGSFIFPFPISRFPFSQIKILNFFKKNSSFFLIRFY